MQTAAESKVGQYIGRPQKVKGNSRVLYPCSQAHCIFPDSLEPPSLTYLACLPMASSGHEHLMKRELPVQVTLNHI